MTSKYKKILFFLVARGGLNRRPQAYESQLNQLSYLANLILLSV